MLFRFHTLFQNSKLPTTNQHHTYETMAADNNSALMALPMELRLAIFALLVVSALPVELVFGMDMSVLTSLSGTSKSIRKEVLELFFKNNTFLIVDSTRSTTFLLKAPNAFIARIRRLKIEYRVSSAYDKILHMMRYSHDEVDRSLPKAIEKMKRLKSCTIVLHQCRYKCCWSRKFVQNQEDDNVGVYSLHEEDNWMICKYHTRLYSFSARTSSNSRCALLLWKRQSPYVLSDCTHVRHASSCSVHSLISCI